MTVTVDLNKHYPHEYSAIGPRVSDSNKVFKLRGVAFPWDLPLTSTPDVALNGLPVLMNGVVARDDPTAGGSWDDSAAAGSKFTDDLVDILDAGTADILLMPSTEAALDKFILGWDKAGGVPVSLNITLSTAGVGGTGTWKYLARDGTWKAFPKVVDESADLTTGTSNYDVLWQIPNDWAPMAETEIDTVERWYLAFEVDTVYSTNPVGTEVTAVVLKGDNISEAPQAPATGVITHLQYKATAGAGNFDTILQLYNWTRQTRGLVTLSTALAQGRAAFSTPLYVKRGDEVTFGAVQGDGTTELTAFDMLMLEIEI